MKFNPLSANPTKWLNTLKQSNNLLAIADELLRVFNHFVGLALKELTKNRSQMLQSSNLDELNGLVQSTQLPANHEKLFYPFLV